MSAKKIIAALQAIGENPCDIKAMLITHEHRDHIIGAGIFSRKYNVPIFANPKTWQAMELMLGKISTDNICLFNTDEAFEIKDIGIAAFEIPHDAAEPVGYNFFVGNKKLSIATDIGKITAKLGEALLGCNTLLLEANHDRQMLIDGKYPHYLKKRILGESGHLSNKQSATIAAALARTGTQRIILGHLSAENNRPELAYNEVAGAISAEGLTIGKDIILDVALRNCVSKPYSF